MAAVDDSGVVTAVGIGTANIICTAMDGGGKSATCAVTVKKNAVTKVKLTYDGAAKKSLTLVYEDTRDKLYSGFEGKALPENATDTSVKWVSSDTRVITIDEESGVFEVVGIGKATVSCISVDNGKAKASCSIKVNKTAVSKVQMTYEGQTQKSLTLMYEDVKDKPNEGFEGKTLPENATYSDVKWVSSNTKVITIDEESGVFEVVGIGKATVSCISVDNKKAKASCTITVKKTAVTGMTVMHNGEIVTSQTVLPMTGGATDSGLSVTFNPSNATYQELTWKTSNKKVVTVEDGVLTAVGSGTATITVTSKDNSKVKLSFKVKVA